MVTLKRREFSEPTRPASGRSVLVLRTLADVDDMARKARSLFNSPRASLDVEGLSAGEARERETRLNLYAANCGCNSGSVTASLGLLGYLAFLAITFGSPAEWRLEHLVWGAAVFLIAALTGKAFGVLRARAQLLGELERLRARLQLLSAMGG